MRLLKSEAYELAVCVWYVWYVRAWAVLLTTSLLHSMQAVHRGCHLHHGDGIKFWRCSRWESRSISLATIDREFASRTRSTRQPAYYSRSCSTCNTFTSPPPCCETSGPSPRACRPPGHSRPPRCDASLPRLLATRTLPPRSESARSWRTRLRSELTIKCTRHS